MSKPDDKTAETIKKQFNALEEIETLNGIVCPTSSSSRIFVAKEIKPLPIHRQARGYLKTTAKLVGKDMERTLFTLPTFESDINPYKETFTKNTAITGNLLISYWQNKRDENGIYTISNLSALAETLGVTPQELKLYLVYLGGYQYPIIKHGIDPKGRKILSIYSDKLFYIKFNILYKDGETKDSFTDDERIGTGILNFIKNRDIASVEISPSQSIQEDLKTHSKGLGNVLVDDRFVAFSLGLSDLAYKIFCYSGSNRPTYKISFDKLVSGKHLNLEKQVYGVYSEAGKRLRAGQGKTRILTRITEALRELKDKGHLTKWAYDEQVDDFSWTYSSEIFKHKELLPHIKAGATEGTDETGQ